MHRSMLADMILQLADNANAADWLRSIAHFQLFSAACPANVWLIQFPARFAD